MSLCSNNVDCGNDGVFLVADPGASPVWYCRACIPTHLLVRANDGHFDPPDTTSKKK